MRDSLTLLLFAVVAHLAGCADTGTDSATDPYGTWGGVTSHLGTSLAYISPGTFTMGCPTDEVGRDSDEYEHEVTLTRAFYIGVYEVTQAEFEEFMGYQPAHFSGCSTCPVEDLTWHEAAAFTSVVSAQAGLEHCYDCSGSEDSVQCDLSSAWASPYDCPGYRLPTEAEWEYAARAGTASAYSNGGNLYEGDSDGDGAYEESDCGGNLELDNGQDLDDIAWYCGNSDEESHPVGELEANAWGLHDVHGNVWEWCHDWHDDYGGVETDPWGPSTSSGRVRRGGSWNSNPRHLRSATRGRAAPSYDRDSLGFRLARSE